MLHHDTDQVAPLKCICHFRDDLGCAGGNRHQLDEVTCNMTASYRPVCVDETTIESDKTGKIRNTPTKGIEIIFAV